MSDAGRRIADGPPLGDDDFRLIRDVLYAQTGLTFRDDQRAYVERRLQGRVRALGLPSFRSYFVRLLTDTSRDSEFQEAVEVLTNHESYFFREVGQLRALLNEVVPALLSQRLRFRPVRILSAGCSSGEEPYTLALLARDERSGSRGTPQPSLEIVATDISRRAIERARRGVFGDAAFRSLPPELKERYFRKVDGGMMATPELRACVRFEQSNIFDRGQNALLGRFDVVLCRNVLIYFDRDAKARAVTAFLGLLAPGGTLMLGHAESLLSVSTEFKVVQLAGGLVYQKPSASREPQGGNAP